MLLALVILLPLGARADCNVSPSPPAPQSCDPGGDAGDGVFCDFTGFTFGTWVTVGTGGTSAATGEARRTVFENQATSTISNCTVVNPQNLSQPLFDAEAHAFATSSSFEVGVSVSDYVAGPAGDPFSGTLEAADARVAAAIDFGTMQSTQDLDAIIHLEGGFSGSGGRATVQLAVRDFMGRTLASVFAANQSPPTNTIVWRELDCPDPRSGCGSFVDHASSWPGFLDIALKIPAESGNGIWIELKTTTPLGATAPSGSVLTTNFGSTAALELVPPPGVTVTLATGQVAQPSQGAPFDLRMLVEGGGYAEKVAMGAGDDVRSNVAEAAEGTAIGRATAGSGRLLAAIESQSQLFFSQVQSQTSFRDTVTASGAEVYRFEIELAGEAAMGPAPPGVDVGEGPRITQQWAVGASNDTGSSSLLGLYEARQPDTPCPMGSVEVENACFTLEPTESSQFPNDVVGSGLLADGPVIVRLDLPLPDGVPAGIRVFLSIYEAVSTNGTMGPVDLTMDLGTTDDRYVRFLGITQAFTGGLPDATWSVISANGYDYSQPAPLVQPVPEPGSGVTILAAWMTLLAARHHSRRDTGVATRAERSAEVSRRLN